MKSPTLLNAAIVAALGFNIAGCSKKPDAESALNKAVQALEQPDAGQPTAPVAAQPPPAASSPATTAEPTPASLPTQAAQQMNQAVASYKGGNYEDAVTRLQWLRSKGTRTPEQAMALQDAMAAVMGDIYARAARGDARAKQAVKEYERLQTAPR